MGPGSKSSSSGTQSREMGQPQVAGYPTDDYSRPDSGDKGHPSPCIFPQQTEQEGEPQEAHSTPEQVQQRTTQDEREATPVNPRSIGHS